MKPVVDRLEAEYGDEFPIIRVDIDTKAGKALAKEQGFIGQPTYIFYDKSGEEVRRLMGPQVYETFQFEVEHILSK